ncbi:MAG: hypothetical protein DI640_15275, partial [Sphingomonas taxi]
MATVDLRGAIASIDIRTPELVKFGTLSGTPTATSWSYLTPTGNRVTVTGTRLRYDASGNPIAGTVSSVTIDAANDGGADLVITGLAAAASPLGSILRSSPLDFWSNVLSGNDVFLGRNTDGSSAKGVGLAGDGFSARAGVSAGGDDIIEMGSIAFGARGDVDRVGSGVSPVTSTYNGGDDEILGLVT